MPDDTEDLASAPPAPAATTVADADAKIAAWFETYCRDSAIARDTPAYNIIHGAVGLIRATLASIKE